MPNTDKSRGDVMEPFHIKDCALVMQSAKLQAQNMRELRECIAKVEAASLYHHFCETLLRPTFDDPVYGNDFATWATGELNDPILAEKLGILNPYEFDNIEQLRALVIDIIDDRLSEMQFIPWARPGHKFFFIKAKTLVFETGNVINHPDELFLSIKNMSNSSLYYHFIEARGREFKLLDDFSTWLMTNKQIDHPFLEPMARLNNTYMALPELKKTLLSVLEPLTYKSRG